MPIPDHHRSNFDTLLRAAAAGDLALLECLDARTGQPRSVICAVHYDAGLYVTTPFGHLCETDDPYQAYIPPH